MYSGSATVARKKLKIYEGGKIRRLEGCKWDSVNHNDEEDDCQLSFWQENSDQYQLSLVGFERYQEKKRFRDA